MRTAGFASGACLFIAVAIAGCGPEAVVQIRYDRPAEYEIPSSVVSLGIAEFAGQDDEDRKWGNIAADMLAMELDTYNKRFNRYRLVDRKRLKAILDEQDLQAAFSDSSSAVQAGKVAQVDAMIYGTATVTTRDERVTRTTIDPLHQRLREVEHTKRYVMAAVNFTIDDVAGGQTLTTVSVMRDYDSDKQNTSGGQKVLKAVGIGGGDIPAGDQVVSQLIEQCVREFVSKISPHEIEFYEKLHKGKSDSVKTGNKLANAGNYGEALDLYLTALKVKPDDHQAAFNAGVMCEKLGRLQKADEYYDFAFKLKPQEQYVLARERVRGEIARKNAGCAIDESPSGITQEGEYDAKIN